MSTDAMRYPGRAGSAHHRGAAAVELAAAPLVRWQPRRVTFLRAVVVRGGEGISPASTHALDRAVEKVHSFGGRVEEISHRGVVATFGHEPAEDAPRRAANAAIAITKAVERNRLSQASAGQTPVTISIHVARVSVAPVGTVVKIDQDAVAPGPILLDRSIAAAHPYPPDFPESPSVFPVNRPVNNQRLLMRNRPCGSVARCSISGEQRRRTVLFPACWCAS